MSYIELEKRFAKFHNHPEEFFISCSSGTAALHLVLDYPNREWKKRYKYILVPDFSMIAIPRAVRMAGLVPILVDCDDTLNMDFELMVEAFNIEEKCSLGVVVDTYGRLLHKDFEDPENYNYTDNVQKGLLFDMSECHGLPPRKKDTTIWSFYKNKVIGGEEGGMICLPDEINTDVIRKLKSLKCLGFTKEHDFNHIPRGYNYRLADCLAEKVIHSLDNYEANILMRRKTEEIFDDMLTNVEEKVGQKLRLPKRDSPWVYDFILPKKLNQDWIVSEINQLGVTCRHFFKPVSTQHEFKGCMRYTRVGNGSVSKADYYSKRGIYLDLGKLPTAEQLEKIRKILIS